MTTECHAKNYISDLDRMAYLEGEAGPEIVEHIESCAFCLQEVAALAAVDALLHDAAEREACPDMDILVQVAAGFQLADQAVENHIAQCEFCQADLQQLMAPAKPAVIDASASKSGKSSFGLDILAWGRNILTALDKPQPQMQLAFRGDSQQEQFFEADPFQLLIKKSRQSQAAPLWKIEGQLLKDGVPFAEENIFVQLIQENRHLSRHALDSFGMFEINDLSSKKYRLAIILPLELILIEEFNVNEP